MPTGNKKKKKKKATARTAVESPADSITLELDRDNRKWRDLVKISPYHHQEECIKDDLDRVDEDFWTIGRPQYKVTNKNSPDILRYSYELDFKGSEYAGGGGRFRCFLITTEERGVNPQRLTPGSDNGWDQHLIRAQLLAARAHRTWVEDIQTGPRVSPGRGPGPGRRGGG